MTTRSLALPGLGLGLLLTTGCCSTDPVGLSADDADTRRETLACIAEEAAEDGTNLELAREAALRMVSETAEPEPAVRAAAARALGILGVQEGTPLLVVRLVGAAPAETGQPRIRPDSHYLVRAEAASSLGALGGDLAGDALRRASRDDPHPDVRLAATRELGGRADSDPETTRALIGALGDEFVAVRLHARRALVGLHELDLGLVETSWRSWYERKLRQDEAEAFQEGGYDDGYPNDGYDDGYPNDGYDDGYPDEPGEEPAPFEEPLPFDEPGPSEAPPPFEEPAPFEEPSGPTEEPEQGGQDAPEPSPEQPEPPSEAPAQPEPESSDG